MMRTQARARSGWLHPVLATIVLAGASCGGEGADGGQGGDGPGAATASVTSATSGPTCPDTFAECDGDPSTVCEASLESDVAHCGGCNGACPAGQANQVARCTSGLCSVVCEPSFADCNGDASDGCETEAAACGPETLVDGIPAPTGLAVDDTHVYFGRRGSPPLYADGYVARVLKGGGDPEILAEGQPRPYSISLGADAVVWSTLPPGNLGDVMAATKEGGDRRTLATGVMTPASPAVIGGDVYFTSKDFDSGVGVVLTAPLDGSGQGIGTEVASDVMDPRDLQAYGDTLFWAEGGVPGVEPRIVKKELPDGEVIVLATGIEEPSYRLGVTFDAVFVGSFVTSDLWRLDGSGMRLLADGVVGQPNEIIVDEARQVLFVSTAFGGSVVALPLVPGHTPVVVAADQKFPSYLAHDEDWLYWTDDDRDADSGAIRRIAK